MNINTTSVKRMQKTSNKKLHKFFTKNKSNKRKHTTNQNQQKQADSDSNSFFKREQKKKNIEYRIVVSVRSGQDKDGPKKRSLREEYLWMMICRRVKDKRNRSIRARVSETPRIYAAELRFVRTSESF